MTHSNLSKSESHMKQYIDRTRLRVSIDSPTRCYSEAPEKNIAPNPVIYTIPL